MARKGRARPTEKRAHGRSLSHFGRLWPAEKLLLEAARVGEIAVIAETRPEARTGENVVRAVFLRFLLLGGDEQAPVHELGAQLQGAWVEGPLNLTYATTTSAIRCERCHFDHPMVMWYARVRGLFCLIGSFVPGIQGDHFRCDGPMYFRDGFESKGSIRLPSAQICGSLEFDGAKLDGLGDDALHADSIDVRGAVLLGEGFEAIGLVTLIFAKIEGALVCSNSMFDGKGKRALLAIQATISGGVYLGEKMRALGSVVFESARIGGEFQVSNCNFNGVGKAALYANSIIIDESFGIDSDTEIVGSVYLREAQIGGQIWLREAALNGQAAAAFSASGTTINGGVFLHEGLEAHGIIDFTGASIVGDFSCLRARIDSNGQAALQLDFAKISGALFMRDGFEANGYIRINYARLEGAIEFGGAVIQGNDGFAIHAFGATVNGDLRIISGFQSYGCIYFPDARIGGTLSCFGCIFEGGGSDSIVLNRADIGGSLIFGSDCKVSGTLSMRNVRVGSNIEFACHVDGKERAAIAASGSFASGSFCFLYGFSAHGEIELVGSHIRGDLLCKAACIDGHGNPAISAGCIEVSGSTYFDEGFSSKGTVNLVAAKIRGDLAFNNAVFDGMSKEAIVIGGAKIDGFVYLREGFKAIGDVGLIAAEIGGDLDLSGACFDAEVVLKAAKLRVSGRLQFRGISSPALRIILNEASVGVLIDSVEVWGNEIAINNFTYGSIAAGSPTAALERIAWLDKQTSAESGLAGNASEFRPQPWRHLQKVLREMGHAEDARQVAIAFEHRMRKAGVIGQSQDTQRPLWAWTNRPRRWLYQKLACFFHWWFWALTGYGYRPMRLMVWMLAVWLGCAAFYWAMALPPRDVFAPSNPLVFQSSFYRPCLPCEQIREATPAAQSTAVTACRAAQTEMHEELRRDGKRFHPGNWYLCPRVREEYTGFSPLAYSLDVILPLVDLQQQKDWGTMIPTPEPGVVSELGTVTWKHVTRFVVWFETLFGWLASLLLVAIVSGLTKRRED